MASEKENLSNPVSRLQRRTLPLSRRQSLPTVKALAAPQAALTLVRRPLRDKRNLQELGSALGAVKKPSSQGGDSLRPLEERSLKRQEDIALRRFSLGSEDWTLQRVQRQHKPATMVTKVPFKELTNQLQAVGALAEKEAGRGVAVVCFLSENMVSPKRETDCNLSASCCAPNSTFEISTSGAGNPNRTFETAASGAGNPNHTIETAASGAGNPNRTIETAASGAGNPNRTFETAASGAGNPNHTIETAASGAGNPNHTIETLASGAGNPNRTIETLASGAGNPNSTFFPSLLYADLSADCGKEPLESSLPALVLPQLHQHEEVGATVSDSPSPVSQHLHQVNNLCLSKQRYFCDPMEGGVKQPRKCLTPVMEEVSPPMGEDKICPMYLSFFAKECDDMVGQMFIHPSSPAGLGYSPSPWKSSRVDYSTIQAEPLPPPCDLLESQLEPQLEPSCSSLDMEASDISLLDLEDVDLELVKLKEESVEAHGKEAAGERRSGKSPIAFLLEKLQSLSSTGSSLEGTFDVSEKRKSRELCQDGVLGMPVGGKVEGEEEERSPVATANTTLVLQPASMGEPNTTVDVSQLVAGPSSGPVNKNDTWEPNLRVGQRRESQEKGAESSQTKPVVAEGSFCSEMWDLACDTEGLLSTDDSLLRSFPLISSTPLSVPPVFNFTHTLKDSTVTSLLGNSGSGSSSGVTSLDGFPKQEPSALTQRASFGAKPSTIITDRKTLLNPATMALQRNTFTKPRMLMLPRRGSTQHLSKVSSSKVASAAAAAPSSSVLHRPPQVAVKKLQGVSKPAAHSQPTRSSTEGSAGTVSSDVSVSRLSLSSSRRVSTAGSRMPAASLPKPAPASRAPASSLRAPQGLRAPASRRDASISGSEVTGPSSCSSRLQQPTTKLARKTADESILPISKKKRVDAMSSGSSAPQKSLVSVPAPRGLRKPTTKLSGRTPESRKSSLPSVKTTQMGPHVFAVPKLGFRQPTTGLPRRIEGHVPSSSSIPAPKQPGPSQSTDTRAPGPSNRKTQEHETKDAVLTGTTSLDQGAPRQTPEKQGQGAAQSVNGTSRADSPGVSPQQANPNLPHGIVAPEVSLPAVPPKTDQAGPQSPVNVTFEKDAAGPAGSLHENEAGSASCANLTIELDSSAASLQMDGPPLAASVLCDPDVPEASLQKEQQDPLPLASGMLEPAASPPKESSGSLSPSAPIPHTDVPATGPLQGKHSPQSPVNVTFEKDAAGPAGSLHENEAGSASCANLTIELDSSAASLQMDGPPLAASVLCDPDVPEASLQKEQQDPLPLASGMLEPAASPPKESSGSLSPSAPIPHTDVPATGPLQGKHRSPGAADVSLARVLPGESPEKESGCIECEACPQCCKEIRSLRERCRILEEQLKALILNNPKKMTH
ncbi:uncharacterized protein LOC136760019 [Amia ocellicauda]|uniref:uncharacterized protein LOC136760019 n=1 Tax=Amia ocellicauda TaxID=2972642 RepID=UPI0034648D0A